MILFRHVPRHGRSSERASTERPKQLKKNADLAASKELCGSLAASRSDYKSPNKTLVYSTSPEVGSMVCIEGRYESRQKRFGSFNRGEWPEIQRFLHILGPLPYN